MSQRYNLKTEEMRDNDPTSEGSSMPTETELDYPSPGNNRTITFIWPDGHRQALDYNYLVCRDYVPAKGQITLLYTTHSVLINGSGLQHLFDNIVLAITRKVIVTDKRYATFKEGTIVSEIIISQV